MEKEFIPYEQALALKELGFDEPCFDNYGVYGQLWQLRLNQQSNIEGACLAPTFSQAFRWFRENYNLHSQTPSTCVEESDRIFYNNPIYDELDNVVFESMEQYTSYEEAELEYLKKLIEIVKEK